ncbi:class I SAM-dependent methyltransferase [Patescibacteria group bacterium]|nr:MAG: class I SAM-dependent methyltransferase [Patescibacteria group bacterium]
MQYGKSLLYGGFFVFCYTAFMSNRLEKYFYKNKGRQIYKWVHYFDIYDRYFKQFRKRPVTVVEFGVLHGGSLQMWKKYFGRKARIIGVDINPGCKQFEEKQIEIFTGDQASRSFLRKLRKEIGPIDVIIDDGGHTMKQQITTFEEMWPAMSDGGVYLIEDLHTSYWKLYGGGYHKRGTFIEFAKDLIDQLNAWHSRDKKRFKVNKYTKSIKAIHTYSSVMVFEKANITRPYDEQRGHESDIEFSYLGFSK